jgi:redox-sensitive bicupin YhaK (pirin superfamily)
VSIRPVKRLIRSKPARDGADVHLRRSFGFCNTSDFDPFLLAASVPTKADVLVNGPQRSSSWRSK